MRGLIHLMLAALFLAGSEISAEQMALQHGETVQIAVYGRDDLSGNRQIDENGQVALPLAGRIQAAGLTPAELETRVSRQMKELGVDSEPRVMVTVERWLDIYVDGGVANPGAYPWRPGLTVSQAIAMSGGRITVSDDEIGPTLAALRSIESAEALERRLHRLRIVEMRLLAQREYAITAFGDEKQLDHEIAPFFDPPESLRADPALADLIDTEIELLERTRETYLNDYNSLITQRSVLRERLDMLEQRRATVDEVVTLIKERLEAIQSLADRGLALQTEVVDLQRASSAATGDMLSVLAAISDARLALERQNAQLAEFSARRTRDIASDLESVRSDLIDVRARRDSAQRAGTIGSVYTRRTAPALSNPAEQAARGAEGDTETPAILIRTGDGAEQFSAVSPTTPLMPGDTIKVPQPSAE